VIPILRSLIQAVQPFLVAICFAIAWSFTILLGWTLWSTVRDTTARAKQMHEIPCPNCQFFTNDHRLKCTVNPITANTEQAIDCSDYRSNL
jgi:hypothetical protein